MIGRQVPELGAALWKRPVAEENICEATYTVCVGGGRLLTVVLTAGGGRQCRKWPCFSVPKIVPVKYKLEPTAPNSRQHSKKPFLLINQIFFCIVK